MEVDPLLTEKTFVVGSNVTLTGYLRYQFEHEALYPADKRDREAMPDACLPVLVPRGDDSMSRQLSGMDEKVVTISGFIDTWAKPGMIAIGGCKDHGIVVQTVHVADKY
jgi:hypothetical protein